MSDPSRARAIHICAPDDLLEAFDAIPGHPSRASLFQGALRSYVRRHAGPDAVPAKPLPTRTTEATRAAWSPQARAMRTRTIAAQKKAAARLRTRAARRRKAQARAHRAANGERVTSEDAG